MAYHVALLFLIYWFHIILIYIVLINLVKCYSVAVLNCSRQRVRRITTSSKEGLQQLQQQQ